MKYVERSISLFSRIREKKLQRNNPSAFCRGGRQENSLIDCSADVGLPSWHWTVKLRDGPANTLADIPAYWKHGCTRCPTYCQQMTRFEGMKDAAYRTYSAA